jgi:anaerobic selenocysteine-containing dehydrogenase
MGSRDETLPGVASLPHGFGLRDSAGNGDEPIAAGPAINELTSAEHCDDLAKTPFHKHNPVRITADEAAVDGVA